MSQSPLPKPVEFDLRVNLNEEVCYRRSEVIFSAGERGDCMFAVLDGEVDLRLGRRRIETVRSRGVFGELALIDGGTRTADAIARTNCRLARIDESRFRRLLEHSPGFALQIIRMFAARLRALDEAFVRTSAAKAASAE